MTYTPRHLIAIVIAALAGLFVAAVLLGSVHDDMRAALRDAHMQRGRALADGQKLAAAVDEYRAALSLEPDDPEARRALALTLLSLDQFAEAESYLRGLLKDRPTDGVLNRALGRIHAARGRDAEARAAYQRAIYGEWPADAVAERIDTRFELIEHLRRLNAREDVLAELLRLKAELPPGHTAAARRVAALLEQAGAADLAIETLAAAVVTAPRDVELLVHLSDMQTAAGRYYEARGTLRRALALDARRPDLALRSAVIDRVLALDPTLPRLGLVTRTRRARLVLSAVVVETRACGDASAVLTDVRRRAEMRLRRPARANAEAAEEDLALASQLWAAASGCHGSGAEARAIAQVLQRIDAAAELPA